MCRCTTCKDISSGGRVVFLFFVRFFFHHIGFWRLKSHWRARPSPWPRKGCLSVCLLFNKLSSGKLICSLFSALSPSIPVNVTLPGKYSICIFYTFFLTSLSCISSCSSQWVSNSPCQGAFGEIGSWQLWCCKLHWRGSKVIIFFFLHSVLPWHCH